MLIYGIRYNDRSGKVKFKDSALRTISENILSKLIKLYWFVAYTPLHPALYSVYPSNWKEPRGGQQITQTRRTRTFIGDLSKLGVSNLHDSIHNFPQAARWRCWKLSWRIANNWNCVDSFFWIRMIEMLHLYNQTIFRWCYHSIYFFCSNRFISYPTCLFIFLLPQVNLWEW